MNENQALFCEPTSFSSVHFDIFVVVKKLTLCRLYMKVGV